MSLFQSAVVCVAVLAICGCDRGQPADFAATKKAAERGDAVAQYKLGAMYALGEGVPKDLVEAYAWWFIAAVGGDADAANNRVILAGELTKYQLSQGQERATELFEKIGNGK